MRPALSLLALVGPLTLVTGIGVILLAGACSKDAAPPPSAPLPPAVLERFHAGVALMDQHSFAKAAEQFEQVVAAKRDWYAAQFNLGLAYLNSATPESYVKAREHLEQARSLKPDLPWAHFALGILYEQIQLEGFGAALAEYQKTCDLDPLDARAHYKLGFLLTTDAESNDDRERSEQGEKHLERSLELDPYLAASWYKLGSLKVKKSMSAEGDAKLKLREQAAAYQARFQELKNSKGAETPSGLKYTEMGRYAEVIRTVEPELVPRATSDIAVKLVAASDTGLPPPTSASPPAAVGITIADIDADGNDDVLLPVDGSIGCYLNDGKGKLARAEIGVPGPGHDVQALAGDYDKDGDLDLYVVREGKGALLENQLFELKTSRRDEQRTRGRLALKDVTDVTHTGLETGAGMASAFADADQDGDLDLFVTSLGDGNHLYSNNGDGTFTDIAAKTGLELKGVRCRKVLFSDLDGDNDTDILVLVEGGRARLFLNDRIQRYHEAQADRLPAQADDGQGAATGDPDADGDWDVLFCRGPAQPALLLENADGRGTFKVDVRATLPAATAGTFVDVDNDGDLDLVLCGGKERPLAVFANDGAGSFHDVSAALGIGAVKAPVGMCLAVADLDLDGDQDLLTAGSGGGVSVWRNDGGNANNWVDVELRGGDQEDASANARGVGARVEVRAGPIYQAQETHAGCGFLAQMSERVHFGLGQQKRVDYVRLVWPDAVVQSEMEIAANAVKSVHETQRKLSSCPTLFTWDGTRFQFVTDFLGVGGLGYFAAPGRYNPPDPTEVVRIAPGLLAPRHGVLELRILEPLEEVSYLDRLELVAIDHRQEVLVLPDERLAVSPPLPTGEPLAIVEQIHASAATGSAGEDVLELIAKQDRRYAPLVPDGRFPGFAEPHQLTLRFALPEHVTGERFVLCANGWVEYGYSHDVFAAQQAGITPQAPSLEVRSAAGDWRVAMPLVGYPAGLNKFMTIDVTDLIAHGARELRLGTNLEVYWDEVFLGRVGPPAAMAVQVLPIQSADLHFKGYPREYRPDGREPLLYDYGIIDATLGFRAMPGRYTRFGDVRRLLARVDDQFVIMGRGEELTLQADAAALPALAPGFARTYLLRSDGYCKDMDLYTAEPDTVEPLPFHGMSAYPYPAGEHYPTTGEHTRYLREDNTRAVLGR